MNKALKQLALVALGALIFVGCKSEKTREEKVAAIITKMDSPFFIMNTNPQNLMDKSGVMDGVLPFTYELILSFFIDESVTGIDYATNAQLIVSKGSGFTPDFYVLFKVKKDETFRELLEKEANAEILEKDGFNYAIKKSDNYAIAWNEEFAMLSSIPIDLTAMLTGKGGDQGMKAVDKCIAFIKGAEEGEANPEFLAFLQKKDDVSMHFDGQGFFSFFSEMSMSGDDENEAMKQILEGMTVDFSMNFNNGEMVMAWESILAEEVMSKFAFIQEKGVDPTLLNYGSGKAPVLVGSYNVQIDGLIDYLDAEMPETGLKEMKAGLEEMGLAWEDISQTLTGQIVYMIDGYEMVEKVYDFGYGETYTEKVQEPQFAIAAGLLHAEKLSAMLAAGESLPNGVIKMDAAYIVLLKDVFFVSNDSAWANAIANGNGSKINDPEGVLTANPFAMYADFNALSKMEDLNDVEPYVNLMISFSGSADLSGGEFKFLFKDDSKNSLRVLTETIADALNRFDEMMNPDIQEDLESAIEESLENIDNLDLDDLEDVDMDAVEDGLKELEESIKNL